MRLASFPVACVVALAGCASQSAPDIRAGDDVGAVTAQLGNSTHTYVRPEGGTRLEFARGPEGIVTYMVDVDVAGKVLGWQQVLTEAHFDEVKPGETEADLRYALGRPSEVRSGDRQGGQVWSYRYAPNGQCEWFQVSINDANAVASSGYGTDPRCDANTGGR